AFVRAQLQAMYCDMEIEPAITSAAPAPALTAAQWHDAMLWARQQAHARQGSYGLTNRRNVNAMFLDNFETPHLFVISDPRHYNRTHGPGYRDVHPYPNYFKDAADIIYSDGGLLELFLRYLTGAASAANPPTANLTRYSTPGLTVVPTMCASRLWRF